MDESSSDEDKNIQPAISTAPIIHPTSQEDFNELPLKSVVKIFVTKVFVKYSSPWQKGHQQKSSGTGFCIQLNENSHFILTNAHIVHQNTVIRVRRPGITTKFVAKVLCVGREVDLALLCVSDNEFWKDVSCLSFDPLLPQLDENVTAVGYPTGGDGISITRGVVSRICLNSYVVGGQALVTIQIDAAINPGNSGGPVFNSKTRKIIGIAQSIIMTSQNIGYIISVPVIHMFLDQYLKNKTFLGCSSLEIAVQNLESPSLREQLHLDSDNKYIGVRVREISPLSPFYGILETNDVLVSIFGQFIASDQTVPISSTRLNERLPFIHLVSSREPGTMCPLVVIRQGKEVKIEAKLKTAHHLVPILHEVDCLPRYYIIGGLVFVPLTRPWIQAAYHRKQPSCIIAQRLMDYPKSVDEEIVILSRVLSAEVNFGFQGFRHCIVTEFNQNPIKNLNHLVQMTRECEDKFLTFTLFYKTRITLNRLECKKSEKLILEQHSIDRPANLKDIRLNK